MLLFLVCDYICGFNGAEGSYCSFVSDANRWKWAWVLKVFEERKKQRNKAVLKEDYSSESIIQEDIDEMSDNMLDFALASFVAEVRKEDGQEYPGK